MEKKDMSNVCGCRYQDLIVVAARAYSKDNLAIKIFHEYYNTYCANCCYMYVKCMKGEE